MEDDELNSMIADEELEYYLKVVKIASAEHGQIAVEQFETGPYDLILKDTQMAVLNGYEATRVVRKIDAAKGTEQPAWIITMTASLLKSEIKQCDAAGMNGHSP